MSAQPVNLALAGVGGQGSVLAGKVVARAAELSGYAVAASEVHGMAQRGGSVFSTVRYGKATRSPRVPDGEADALVAFEKLEALRFLGALKPGGLALVNAQRITPSVESLKGAPYPEDVEEALNLYTRHVWMVPGLDVARELGNPKLANAVVLGALSRWLELPEAAWLRALEELVPPKTVQLNREAFARGRAWAGRKSKAPAGAAEEGSCT